MAGHLHEGSEDVVDLTDGGSLHPAEPGAGTGDGDGPLVRRVLIVDDEPDIRLLLRMVLELGSGHALEVCDEVAGGGQALAAWERHRPDVTILDWRLPDVDGLEVARRILERDPDARLAIFSSHLRPDAVAVARALGVRWIVDKSSWEDLPDLVST